MEEEVKKVLDSHEERLLKIEKILFDRKTDLKDITEKYEGLNGGIRLLIKNGFLNSLKSMKEISLELKRLGYIYSVNSISKALFVDFMKKKKLLTRIEENKIWKYSIKK